MTKSIAIDGPSGAGKSTISQCLAKEINFDYLDTGAMYRAYTFFYLQKGIDIQDEACVEKYLDQIQLDIIDGEYVLNGKNIEEEIRSKEVTDNVSLISSYKSIREKLVGEQRHIANKKNIIVDGRDIGSYVLPNASIKFYLDAKPEIRAKRRLDQYQTKQSFEEVLADILRRDKFDSQREISPLRKADDAIYIDSSNCSLEETIKLLIQYLRQRHVI